VGPARGAVLKEFMSFSGFLGHSVISYSFHVVYRIVLGRIVPCTAPTAPVATVRAGSVLNYAVRGLLENVHLKVSLPGHTAGFTGCPAVLSLLAGAFQTDLASSVSHGISMSPQTA
jgi:hypothetical protein